VIQDDRAMVAVDRRALRARLQHDVVAGDAAGARDQRIFGRDGSEENGFGERRFLVRLAVLAGEERDDSGGVLLFGRNRREGTGRATADHENSMHRSGRSGRSDPRQALSAVSMSSMYSSLSAITTISDHGRSCASVFDNASWDPDAAPTTNPVVITRRRLHAWPIAAAASARPPGPATRMTRSAVGTSSAMRVV